ncbi:MAG: DoxX family protein [Candidatus Pacebacteria bacterium]|nr:DoxX family protein [Candidatus Paceibacterota bacterium]MCD8508072.1 DoxX family protein [Candidatus Paceibacterota bacterium]MCD8528205.1 DoxX family protein [Candidatus Paceibacterota bacterium]MCD8563844.1 DoxX family protein [Candidatus Paceibacterota bacterium]
MDYSPKKKTAYRGAHAGNIVDEFKAYGLPLWSVYVVGGIKLIAATALLVGIIIPLLVVPSALALLIMMMGAIAMHIKIKDSLMQTAPALIMLALAVAVIALA